MFVDASVIVAILSKESDWDITLRRLEAHEAPLYISPLVRFEVVQALARKRASHSAKPSAAAIEEADLILDAFITRLRIEEIAVSVQIGALAVKASMRYGKAVGHPADLNFGDCFAYACAKALDVPLAYKGNDFALTDIA
ncbi:type II toxin-antitoxin system VapC family toxin [Mesorhizobium sp. CGMCC 1.15528]|uniref:Ribonuclease VapC n=1 Tax=Mesorhizobium zhangyense TaxID=1776730 RepID=A0A7C9R946_9HYPH|nr:type II toxin-antitoxin system VapC family toxin [Mesorhizobium zhangyense]NGN43095.1 type II toxin-antitoxin system VapC family toxin [Mesorhizobium zhangyense]